MNRGKTLLKALVAAGLLLAAGAARAGETVGRLPAPWFQLPEDVNGAYYAAHPLKNRETKDGNTYDRSEQAVSDSIDKIFYYTADSLETSGKLIGSRERPANAPTDWTPWHLSSLIMDLGVNAAGTAGLVTGIGEASVEVQWQRTLYGQKALGVYNEVKATAEANGEAEDASDVSVSELSTPLDIEAQVDRVADAVMATGKVTDRAEMRGGLLRVAKDLQAVMVNVNSYNDSYWDINKFGLDVEISVSGKVSVGFTAGLGVRLRFEWKRMNYGAPLAEPNDADSDKRESLRKLLAGVAKDMDTVSSDLYAGSGFGLTTMRLGVGLYFAANFGVVKGKLGATGFAYFSKSNYKANRGYDNSHPHIIDKEIPLVDDQPEATHLAYADQVGVKYDKVPGGDDARDRVVYYMTRDKFQKGLQNATKMGAWFAKRAKKQREATGQNYGGFVINQVKPQFALSLEGGIVIATIGGKVSLELTFKPE